MQGLWCVKSGVIKLPPREASAKKFPGRIHNMATLTVTEFSCIHDAKIDLSRINVLIGPQGSGKSVTTKLLNFCIDIPLSFVSAAEKGLSYNDYKKFISRQFAMWFPPQAWGQGRSNISYTAGDFSIRVLRRTRNSKPSDEVSVKFSDWFELQYELALQDFAKARSSYVVDNSYQRSLFDDPLYRVKESIVERYYKSQKKDHIAAQTFVPAGRAFFTSIGRLVAGFEHAGALDPVTLKFARLFAGMRDRLGWRGTALGGESEHFLAKRLTNMQRLFGGEIQSDGETEFVRTDDGRKVPLSSLSSGQQELLPIWSIIDLYSQQDEYFRKRKDSVNKSHLLYIEEPEAHLFPSAQSMLMELLIGDLVGSSERSLFITTHSPYVLSKLNVFLKAGQLSRRKKRNQAINDIVPRECWIDINSVSAFAIKDGYLVDILDNDFEMIDSEYLDEISNEVSKEYSSLLQIESEI